MICKWLIINSVEAPRRKVRIEINSGQNERAWQEWRTLRDLYVQTTPDDARDAAGVANTPRFCPSVSLLGTWRKRKHERADTPVHPERNGELTDKMLAEIEWKLNHKTS